MLKTRIRTTNGREYLTSTDIGRKIRISMANGLNFVALDEQKNKIIKTSTIAEIEDIPYRDPLAKTLPVVSQERERKPVSSEHIQKWKKKLQEIREKKALASKKRL